MNYQEAYDSVKLLNTIFGRLDNKPSKAERAFQLELIKEELNETINGLGSPIDELDGACDMFVTVAGYMAQLERLGFDVQRALEKVCENNLTKVIGVFDIDELTKTSEKFKKENIDIEIVNSSVEGICLVKNAETGKVLKPASFVSVDISDCLPKGV